MTKLKAFLMCLILPLVVVFGVPWLLPLGEGEDFTMLVRILVLIPLVPLSLFVPPFTIGGEFRKYGLYGTLASMILGVALLLYYYPNHIKLLI